VADSSPFPTRAELLALRKQELAYARLLGLGTALFLLVWAPFSLSRWVGQGPGFVHFEAGFFFFYGLLLIFPYHRIRSFRLWRALLIVLAVASLLFVFVLVFDVLYIANLYVDNSLASAHVPEPQGAVYDFDEESGTGPRLPFPALNCVLVFLALLQVPAVLFSRYPEWLD
jgi:hypothetical protein